MSRQVSDYVHNRYNIDVDVPYFGIEVEVESCYNLPPELEDSPWRAISDGSLRNAGIEFLSKRPMTGEEIVDAVPQLYEWQSYCDWTTGVRTSTHVHVNVMGFNLADLATVGALYSLMEPLLFRYAGPVREENIYCVPWYRAPKEADNLAVAVHDNVIDMLSGTCKYSALYMEPVLRFGTVEFRQAPVFAQSQHLMDWVSMCECIVYNDFKSADDVVDTFRAMTVDMFVERVFGAGLRDVLKDKCELSFEDLLEYYDVESIAEKFCSACTYKPTAPQVWRMSPHVEGNGAHGYHSLAASGMGGLEFSEFLAEHNINDYEEDQYTDEEEW